MQGIALERLGEDATQSFAQAERIQRQLLEKSNNIISRRELLKILARAGHVDEAMKLAEQMESEADTTMPCGYAACGFALISEHFAEDDPRRLAMASRAIELTQKLIRQHQYHNFESLRSTDLDFEPLWRNEDYLKMLDEEQTRIANEEPQGPS